MFARSSRRSISAALLVTIAAAAVILTCGCGGSGGLSSGVQDVIESPVFKHSPWAIRVADLETGEVLESYNPDMMLDPASTTKCFTVASALDTLGKDHKFKTPVYANGELEANGVLSGDLVLVADGDISMGGRTLEDGTIEYTPEDHTDANALGNCVLTKTDPLQGLDDLARQVAKSGVKSVKGDVVVDDRLYGPERPFSPEADYALTSIMVNDNLVDIMIEPGEPGAPASMDYRPKSAAYRVESTITTGPKNGEAELEVDSSSPGIITITGQVPAGGGEVVQTYAVEDPAAFARTLFIEALERAGVTVTAPATGANPSGKLPSGDYSAVKEVAALESPPFSEFAKLILKVSHNPGADTCLLLMAVDKGKKTMEDGLAIEKSFLEKAGVDIKGLILNDGQGSAGADYIAPTAAVDLLTYMSKGKNSKAFFNALPVMGVDGTLATIMTNSPVKGKAQAKTGTHGGPNILNQGMWVSRALAGYMTAKSGRKLVYDIVVSDAPAGGMKDMQTISEKHARVLELIYEQY